MSYNIYSKFIFMAFENLNDNKSILPQISKIIEDNTKTSLESKDGSVDNESKNNNFKMSENSKNLILKSLDAKISSVKFDQDSQEYIQALNRLKIQISSIDIGSMSSDQVKEITEALEQLKRDRIKFLQSKRPLTFVGSEVKKANDLIINSKEKISKIESDPSSNKDKKVQQLTDTKNRLLSEVKSYETFLKSLRQQINQKQKEKESLQVDNQRLQDQNQSLQIEKESLLDKLSEAENKVREVIEEMNLNLSEANLKIQNYQKQVEEITRQKLDSDREVSKYKRLEDVNEIKSHLISLTSDLMRKYFYLQKVIKEEEIDSFDDVRVAEFEDIITQLEQLLQESNLLEFKDVFVNDKKDNNKNKIQTDKKIFESNKIRLSSDIQKILTDAYNKRKDLFSFLEKNDIDIRISEHEKVMNTLAISIKDIDDEVKKAKTDEKNPDISKTLEPSIVHIFESKYNMISSRLDVLLEKVILIKKHSPAKSSLIETIKSYKNKIKQSSESLKKKEPSIKTAEAVFNKAQEESSKVLESIKNIKKDIESGWLDPKDSEGKTKLIKFPKDIKAKIEYDFNNIVVDLKDNLNKLYKLENSIKDLRLNPRDLIIYDNILKRISLSKKNIQDRIDDLDKEIDKLSKPNLEAYNKIIEKSLNKISENVTKADDKLLEMKDFLFKEVEPKSNSWFGKKIEQAFVSPHTWKDAESFYKVYTERNDIMSEVLEDLEKQVEKIYDFGDEIISSNLNEKDNQKMMDYFNDLKKKLRSIKISIQKHNTNRLLATVRGLIKNPKLTANLIWNNVSERIDNTVVAISESVDGYNDKQSKEARSELWQGAGKKTIYGSSFVVSGVAGLVTAGLAVMGGEYLYNKYKERGENDQARSKASQAGAAAMS